MTAGTLARMIWIAVLGGCFGTSPSRGGGQISDQKVEAPRARSHVDIDVPDGYHIELVTRGLTFPTGIAISNEGALYLTEAGYSYGEVVTQARVIEIDPRTGRVRREITRGKHAPWNGLAYHDGALYVSQGGAIESRGRIVKLGLDGRQNVLVDELPSGDHHTNGPIVVDGWVYFGQGTITNSGVVGVDNHDFGWLARQPGLHDTPCKDVTLAGTNFESRNPLTAPPGDQVWTGAYLPFGTPSQRGQKISGSLPCSGAVMRVPVNGGPLELVAWGFRNPFALASANGSIYVSENGYDVRGSRPVFGSPDVLWKLEAGSWYGWPDHAGGVPLTADGFSEAGGDPKGFVLASHPGEPPRPLARLDVHSSANGFDVARPGPFGYAGHAFVALFGDMAPTVGKVMGPVGFKVVRVDLATGIYRDFARNRGDAAGPASRLGTHGLERPVAARFDPRGEQLYVVDFGVMRMTEKGALPEPGTGALWRITREGPRADVR